MVYVFLFLGLGPAAVILAQKNKFLNLLGSFYLIGGIGINYLFFSNSRNRWWNNDRPIFGSIWLLFSYFALTKQKSIAWKILSLDVIYGLLVFIKKHYLL